MKIKTNILKYKDPNTGQYTSIPVIAGGSSEGSSNLTEADYEAIANVVLTKIQNGDEVSY